MITNLITSQEPIMDANPVLKKLGLTESDRVVIIHADDIGMCHATLPAIAELMDFGLVSCASVMVPCPWFSQVATYCREHPAVDMGVHLTLTSEWGNYRWGPISTRDPRSGLMDEADYFYQRSQEVQEGAEAEAVQGEIEAQVAQALAAGIDVTHIDSHMGSIFHAKFIAGYIQLAWQHQFPALLIRSDERGLRQRGFDAQSAAMLVQQTAHLEAQGMPFLDNLLMMPLDQAESRLEHAKHLFDTLPPGITYFIIHPAQDTPELRAIAPDWRARVADYQTFMSADLRNHIKEAGIHVIGSRKLREMMRS